MIKYVLFFLIMLLLIYLLLSSSKSSSDLLYSNGYITREKFENTHTNTNKQETVMEEIQEEIQEEEINDPTKNIRCEQKEVKSCASGKCGVDHLYPILEATFNLREASKQCLLLEDHLNNNKKRCYDCLKKHFLITDGLLEESIGLEKDNILREQYRRLLSEWIRIEKKYAKNQNDPNILDEISKDIRMFRKPLVEKYFDTVSDYDI